jgi:lysophospholipase L1-like esterase
MADGGISSMTFKDPLMNKTSRRNFIRNSAAAGIGLPFGDGLFSRVGSKEKKMGQEFLQASGKEIYLEGIKQELVKAWPENRTINLVFHGHSVPAGYFKTPVVNTFQSYPFLLLKDLKASYPFAVVNAIVTSIGGENSMQGAARFKKEVLVHKPDVVFIDYALNDQRMGLSASGDAWSAMIKSALKNRTKVILMTATPDQRVDLLNKDTELQRICDQINQLAMKYGTGLVDNYKVFQNLASSGGSISDHMSQVNHPNAKGHQLIADGIMRYF